MYLRRFTTQKSVDLVDRVVAHRVRSAARHIAGYRDLLERSGVPVTRVRGAGNLADLPMVRKELLHDLPMADLLHERARPAKLFRTSTSGYTGMPISIYMSPAEAVYRQWQLLRSWKRYVRLPMGFRVVDFGGWVEEASGYRVARRGPATILRISQRVPGHRQVELVERFAPHVLTGPPSILDLFAQEVGSAGVALRSVRLIAIRGEILFEAVRDRIATTFGCRVADFYSCEEIGVVAYECPTDSEVLHVNADLCIVEIVDDEGTPMPLGREGRVLLTNLYNFTMPFIRYDIGDRGVLATSEEGARCACGSPWPKMRLLGGREDDYGFLPDGTRASARLLGTAIYQGGRVPQPDGEIEWLFRGFRATQDALDHLTIEVIPETEDLHRLKTRIEHQLRGVHPLLRCTVVETDDIPREPSGKLRKFICTTRHESSIDEVPC